MRETDLTGLFSPVHCGLCQRLDTLENWPRWPSSCSYSLSRDRESDFQQPNHLSSTWEPRDFGQYTEILIPEFLHPEDGSNDVTCF